MDTWFIIAQLLGLITIGFEFTSYQIKDKTKYFLVTGIGSFFWMAMFVAIGISTGMDTQFSLIVAAVYSTIRNLVFFGIFKKNTAQSKELGLNFLLVMIVIAIVAGTATVLNAPEQVRWLHIIGLVVALGFVIGQYLPGVHYVRIAVVFYAVVVLLTQTPINILYGDFRWNIMGILIEAAKIISVVVFYIRYSTQPKTPQLVFAKP
ncbi:MAG: YgjV family protein [Defluviitaleaceae bacterium]|nr:YgjV family protein [Defluviitaleaceae bacterium]